MGSGLSILKAMEPYLPELLLNDIHMSIRALETQPWIQRKAPS
jgi:hypothetical protein